MEELNELSSFYEEKARVVNMGAGYGSGYNPGASYTIHYGPQAVYYYR